MMHSIKKKTINSLFWKAFERGGSFVANIVVQVLLARLLAPAQFGTLAIMLVFVNLGNVVVQSGLNTALIQSSKATKEDYSTVFWLSLTISLVLYALVFVAAPYIADFYGMMDIVWPLRVLALIFIINAYNAIQVAAVMRSLELKKMFLATVVSVIISGIIGVSCALVGAELWALVAQQLSYQVASCLILSIQVKWRPRFVFRFHRAKALFHYGWKLLFSGLLDAGYQGFSDLIIGKQFSSQQLGFVSQGKKYPQSFSKTLDEAIQPVMLSAFSHVQKDIPYVKRLMRRALKTSTFFVIPVMSLLAVIAEPLVRLLLGEQWLPCVPFMQMYCFIFALLPVHTINLQAINGVGRSELFLKLELIKKSLGFVVIIVAALVLKNVYMIVAGHMLTGLVSTLINAWPNKRLIGYGYIEQIYDIAPSFLTSLVATAVALVVGLSGLSGILLILLQVVMFGVAYFSLASWLRLETLLYLKNAIGEWILNKKVKRGE